MKGRGGPSAGRGARSPARGLGRSSNKRGVQRLANYDGLPPQAFWIWLQHGLGFGSEKPKQIASFYSALRTFAEGGRREWRLMGFLTNKEMDLLESYTPEDAAHSYREWQRKGIRAVSMADAEYPPLLREIQTPPAVLYVAGKLPDFEKSVALAVVGTREATVSGMRVARRFSCALANRGMIIVSGGAIGIDSAAHSGALDAEGITVCVLGCGLLYGYLRENEDLRRRIARTGALVSEFTPETPAARWTFPMRNRIIAGLCQGTLVVEAANRSGALITAEFAAEEGRDVFAIPGSVENSKAGGVNALIRDGAVPITDPVEIFEEYRKRYPKRLVDPPERPIETPFGSGSNSLKIEKAREEPRRSAARTETAEQKQSVPIAHRKRETAQSTPAETDGRQNLSETALLVLEKLSSEGKYVDTLCAELGLPVGKVLSALLELELAGKAVQSSGKRYSLP